MGQWMWDAGYLKKLPLARIKLPGAAFAMWRLRVTVTFTASYILLRYCFFLNGQ